MAVMPHPLRGELPICALQMGGTPYRARLAARDRVMIGKRDRRKENAVMIEQLTGILYISGLTLLRFGVPVVLTFGLSSLLRRAVSSAEPRGAQ